MFFSRSIFTIAKKEVASLLNSPTGYVILCSFLFLWEFIFFRSVFLVGESSLRSLFSLLPWMFLFLIPCLTMGSFVQEKLDGTLELLLTHPIKESDLIIGKFLSILSFIFFGLLFIVPIAVCFNFYGDIDFGAFFVQCIGSLLLASVLVSIGLFISTLVRTQVSSFLLSFLFMFFAIMLNSPFITEKLPVVLSHVLDSLSVVSHFSAISRGAIDTRDVIFFLSSSFIFLNLAYLMLLRDRISNSKVVYRTAKFTCFLFIAIAVVVNVLGYQIPGRIDLTKNGAYTLSDTTKSVLQNLNDIVNITLYSSEKLPPQFQPVIREVKELLKDYKVSAKGDVVIHVKDPSADNDVKLEAQSYGIQTVQFNVVGQEEFQVKTGNLGLVVSYGGQHESIPFIQRVDDLEYRLTSFIKNLTDDNKKKLGFISTHGAKGISSYANFSSWIEKQFDIQTVDIGLLLTQSQKSNEAQEEKEANISSSLQVVSQQEQEDVSGILNDYSVIVIAGPNQLFQKEQKEVIEKYIQQGGSVLFFVDAFNIEQQQMRATLNEHSMADFVSQYGVNVNSNLVYDLKSNETVQVGGGPFSFFLPYPFWIRALSVKDSRIINSQVSGVLLPWASSIEVDQTKVESKGFQSFPILQTSDFAGIKDQILNLSIQNDFPKDNLKSRVVAVALRSTDEDIASRLVIVGNSKFLEDRFSVKDEENFSFGLEILSWLSQEDSLAQIRLKKNVAKQLEFTSAYQVIGVKWFNILLPVVFSMVFGFYRSYRRKKVFSIQKKVVYEEN